MQRAAGKGKVGRRVKTYADYACNDVDVSSDADETDDDSSATDEDPYLQFGCIIP